MVSIKKKFNIDLTDNVQLRISLSLHLIPLLIRLKYNMQLSNELVSEVQKSFQLAFDIASSFAYAVQQKYNYRIVEDEIAYFAIYFNNAFSQQKDNKGKTTLLIISSLKRSETLLLRERINSWFSNAISELSIKGAYEVKESDFQGETVVCTTEKNQFYYEKEALLINQFPNREDFLHIKMRLDGFKNKENILKMFSQEQFYVGKSKNKEEIVSKLGKYIEQKEKDVSHLVDEVLKREAMGGTYYGNRVAMPHPMHPITHRTYISAAILNSDLEWDENENQVRLILLVSMEKDNPKVFQLWSYLSEFINNESLVSKVIKERTFDVLIDCFSKAIDKVDYELREY